MKIKNKWAIESSTIHANGMGKKIREILPENTGIILGGIQGETEVEMSSEDLIELLKNDKEMVFALPSLIKEMTVAFAESYKEAERIISS